MPPMPPHWRSACRLKKNFEDLFFGKHLHLCSWSLASRGSVLGKSALGLELFLCPWPWPRALYP